MEQEAFTHTQQMGMQTGPTTLENSLAIYAQVKYTCMLGLSNFTHMNIRSSKTHTFPRNIHKKLSLDQLWYSHIIAYTEDE